MFRIAVLISGSGSNLQALMDAADSGIIHASVSMVIADRPAGGLGRAAASGIPSLLIDRRLYGSKLSMKIAETLQNKADMVVLAGFLSILDNNFIQLFNGRILNIHPSLLPAYGGKGMYGMRVHRAVLDAGEKTSGCTVHFVEAGIDTGKIIARRQVPVKEDDTPCSLQRRMQKEEHRLIVHAVGMLIEDLEEKECV